LREKSAPLRDWSIANGRQKGIIEVPISQWINGYLPVTRIQESVY
jgi:hypothetical protein